MRNSTWADHLALESDLNKVQCWAKTWQMDVNVSKCAVLSVTTKRKPSAYDYYMDDQQIPRADNQDYLLTTINTKLSWQPHINKVQNKARKTLGLTKRKLHAASSQVRITAHEVLDRPTLEYTTCAWSSHPRHTFRKLNRSEACFVTGDYRRISNVTAMCANLMWDTLYPNVKFPHPGSSHGTNGRSISQSRPRGY